MISNTRKICLVLIIRLLHPFELDNRYVYQVHLYLVEIQILFHVFLKMVQYQLLKLIHKVLRILNIHNLFEIVKHIYQQIDQIFKPVIILHNFSIVLVFDLVLLLSKFDFDLGRFLIFHRRVLFQHIVIMNIIDLLDIIIHRLQKILSQNSHQIMLGIKIRTISDLVNLL